MPITVVGSIAFDTVATPLCRRERIVGGAQLGVFETLEPKLGAASRDAEALASFNVEEFGTDRVARLTTGEVHERVCDPHAMSRLPDLRARPITTATRSASHERVR